MFNFIKKLKVAATVLLLANAGLAAASTLQLGEGVNLLVLNGEEVTKDTFFGGVGQVKLKDGQNQILVTYTADIKKGGDDDELETTQTSVVLFETTAPSVTINAPEIEKASAVEKFNQELNWILVDSNNKPVPYKVSILKKSGFQLSRDFEREIEEFNTTSAAAALQKELIKSPRQTVVANTSQAVSTVSSNPQPQSQPQTVEGKNLSMDMLIYWYNQADEKTRRTFKALIKNK